MALQTKVSTLDPNDPHTRSERSERTAELLRQRNEARSDEERRRIVADLVLVNRGVAVALAMRYRGRGVPLEDLCQTAFEGLTKAVSRFDSDLAEDLLTYAVPTIRGELQRHFRDHTWMVRPPRRVQELQRRVNELAGDLSQALGREPSRRELADYLSLDESDVDEAQRAHDCFSAVSLETPVTSDSSATLADVLCDEEQDDRAETRIALAPAVSRLCERDQRILYLRFFEDRTQAEIGRDLGVSQMQVSRLLARLLGQLREEIA